MKPQMTVPFFFFLLQGQRDELILVLRSRSGQGLSLALTSRGVSIGIQLFFPFILFSIPYRPPLRDLVCVPEIVCTLLQCFLYVCMYVFKIFHKGHYARDFILLIFYQNCFEDLFMLPCIICTTFNCCVVFHGEYLSHFAYPFLEC